MKRIAVLNRGEPALRFLRALKEFNIEHEFSIVGIALFTEADKNAPFVRFADEAISIGEPIRPNGVSAYCDHEYIIDILKANKIDSLWPGWGFFTTFGTVISMMCLIPFFSIGTPLPGADLIRAKI